MQQHSFQWSHSLQKLHRQEVGTTHPFAFYNLTCQEGALAFSSVGRQRKCVFHAFGSPKAWNPMARVTWGVRCLWRWGWDSEERERQFEREAVRERSGSREKRLDSRFALHKHKQQMGRPAAHMTTGCASILECWAPTPVVVGFVGEGGERGRERDAERERERRPSTNSGCGRGEGVLGAPCSAVCAPFGVPVVKTGSNP